MSFGVIDNPFKVDVPADGAVTKADLLMLTKVLGERYGKRIASLEDDVKDLTDKVVELREELEDRLEENGQLKAQVTTIEKSLSDANDAMKLMTKKPAARKRTVKKETDT
ncbi:hypothetical protein [Primorskyibacter sp. S87]|uniref:hypothetical protein n=1 Tax=Primorskyibacter sp. S87 TaxID=3415126 RepID=UPI003C7C14DC